MDTLSALLAISLAGTFQDGSTPIIVQPIEAAPHGYCANSDGPIDLDAILFLRNESVRIGEGLEARINGEHIYINEIGQREAFTYFSVATAISPTTDIDIRLEFASLNGQVFVYWKETYLHRIYRQGLFRIDATADWPDRLTPYCEGEGGEWISH